MTDEHTTRTTKVEKAFSRAEAMAPHPTPVSPPAGDAARQPVTSNSQPDGQAEQEQGDLPELDGGTTDGGDSAYGDSEGSIGETSISSSFRRGHVEGGRRYQILRENNFQVPSDEKQFESMHAGHLGHTVMESLRENPYFRSPISKDAQHIIDLGTGTGGWASDVADMLPNLTVHGVDLYPPPMEWVPPNCIFEVDDFTKPWTWNHKFDLVHMRLLAGALPRGEWSKLYKRIYDNLQPGGWIEHVEPDIAFHSLETNPLPKDSLLCKWKETISACSSKTGNETDIPPFMKVEIEKAGFINVHELKFKMPTGDWHAHPIYKDAGRLNTIHFKEGLSGWVGYALTHFGTDKPWSQEETTVYVAKMRQELDANYHLWQMNTRVWAQKPYDAPKAETEQPILETVAPATA